MHHTPDSRHDTDGSGCTQNCHAAATVVVHGVVLCTKELVTGLMMMVTVFGFADTQQEQLPPSGGLPLGHLLHHNHDTCIAPVAVYWVVSTLLLGDWRCPYVHP
jgi:hypothetical protein